MGAQKKNYGSNNISVGWANLIIFAVSSKMLSVFFTTKLVYPVSSV